MKYFVVMNSFKASVEVMKYEEVIAKNTESFLSGHGASLDVLAQSDNLVQATSMAKLLYETRMELKKAG